MAEHHHEEEQLEAIKRWWQENGTFVIAGLVIGVTVVGGWRGYEWYMNRQAEAASKLYADMSAALAADEGDKVDALATQLMGDYAMTPYAAQAALIEAKRQVDAGKLAEAKTALEWAVAHGKDDELVMLARIRLARVETASGDATGALKTLEGIGGAFAALADDARGDAHTALGHPADARRHWQQALDASTGNLADRALIELKLQALGPAPAATASAAGAPATTAPAPTAGTKP